MTAAITQPRREKIAEYYDGHLDAGRNHEQGRFSNRHRGA